jgi:mannose-6-phosphate isomerase-like protein (cupin superfamily)
VATESVPVLDSRLMSDYTITNFMDVEDSAASRSPDGSIQARFARSSIDSDHLGVSHFKLAPNFRAPFGHRHREQEEVYVVIAGSGKMRLDDKTEELKLWDVVRVAPQVGRAYESGPDGLVMIAIGSDRPEGGDGEMLPEFWGD